jgi:predicted transcriptional regulator
MNLEDFLDKIFILLDPTEEIEYSVLQKNVNFDFIALTNKRVIYSNLNLQKDDVFYFFDILSDDIQNIENIIKILQSDDSEFYNLINNYFS